jgi:hypothetical protein
MMIPLILIPGLKKVVRVREDANIIIIYHGRQSKLQRMYEMYEVLLNTRAGRVLYQIYSKTRGDSRVSYI